MPAGPAARASQRWILIWRSAAWPRARIGARELRTRALAARRQRGSQSPRRTARCVVGRPRRRSSSSIAGRSSCTSEYACTSSTAAAIVSSASSAARARARRSRRRAVAERVCRRRAPSSASLRAVASGTCLLGSQECRRASSRFCGDNDRGARRMPSCEARAIIASHPNTETARPAQAFVNTESSRNNRASAADLAYQGGISSRRVANFRVDDSGAARGARRSHRRMRICCAGIADTIEDDVRARQSSRNRSSIARFVAVVKRRRTTRRRSRAISCRCCRDRVLPAEHDLVRNAAA